MILILTVQIYQISTNAGVIDAVFHLSEKDTQSQILTYTINEEEV